MAMTFRQFVFHNVFRNVRLYAAYFLSSLFTVSVFFTFAIFAFHPELAGPGMNSHVLKGMAVAGGIIYVFSFFYVLYSMNAFLRSRKKEFGVLLIHGMTSYQIRWMVFLENMIIGFAATGIGILLGLIFAKAVLLIAETVLEMDQSLYFYFPTLAIVVTFVSFITLFFFISVFITFMLRTKKIISLIKGDAKERKEPKFSIILSVLAILLLATGYGMAFSVEGIKVMAAFVPVVVLVIVGTYLFFSQLSIFVISRLKKNENVFWRKTNMLLFADLAFRMKDNARAFFLVAIISTVAFSAIGTLFGFNSYLTKEFQRANPISFSYIDNTSGDRVKVSEDLELIERTLEDYGLSYKKESVTLHHYAQEENKPQVVIAPVSDYNKYARLLGEKEIALSDAKAIPVEESAMTIATPDLYNYELKEITFKDGSTIPVDWDELGKAKRDILPAMFKHYLVSDEQFAKLGEPVHSETYYHFDVDKADKEQLIEIGQLLEEKVSGRLIATDYIVHEIRTMYAPFLFVGLFIGIIFFVSAASFIYFRLYTDLDEDEAKFKAISKLGLSVKELKQIVSQQTAILFFAPIVVAIIHGSVALYALSNFLNYDVFTESLIVLSSFFIIQVIYYFVARHMYIRQLINTL